jgi:hypothetical protein
MIMVRRESVIGLHQWCPAIFSQLSQLHRHIAGIDDCVFCRAGEILPVTFGCSTSEVVNPVGQRSDAALPFLSAASGLMLATLLQNPL